MNLYDFDNTIYDGESTVDFFLFCLKKKKSLIKYMPLVLYTGILYKMRLLSSIDKLIEAANEISSAFVNNDDDLNKLINEFWKVHKKNKTILFIKTK